MYQTVGKRKSSVARITMEKGTGKIIVNKKDIKDYFSQDTLVNEIKQGLIITDTEKDFDIVAKVSGGGFSGQAGALKHAIVKSLLLVSDDYRKPLKQAKLISRDSRVKERKKYGLKGARRAPQFSKR
ncbi:30S ribosomal protein S9 [Candidatus Hepatoplasma crinochetorum]|jgi:small subunit ribosomal protein S9|uniref:Small ribosomal subunit protein uS9 n=1 Tax=Candidatus Hepatoplasma crinochetorum Av TaxID=1427984 RepID=W8GJ54_9MOLU|nr:30S ribosomal protein S9 [Candidatus Hepatoplasma crinochetorum]AHK22277.1 30S ribosomal protein S9 [Candidatus Hepatoplasma crinochetorum Av]BDV02863.1 MAG: 30S ribosomal protein S9 [Candidatus Hepatoplasma crinochetorum]